MYNNLSVRLESESLRRRWQEGTTSVQENNKSEVGESKYQRDSSCDEGHTLSFCKARLVAS